MYICVWRLLFVSSSFTCLCVSIHMSVHVINPILFHFISASFVLLDFKISNQRLLEIRIKLLLFKKNNHAFPCINFKYIILTWIQHLKNVLPIYPAAWEITKYIDSSFYSTQANILHIKCLMTLKGNLQCITASLHLKHYPLGICYSNISCS